MYSLKHPSGTPFPFGQIPSTSPSINSSSESSTCVKLHSAIQKYYWPLELAKRAQETPTTTTVAPTTTTTPMRTETAAQTTTTTHLTTTTPTQTTTTATPISTTPFLTTTVQLLPHQQLQHRQHQLLARQLQLNPQQQQLQS